VFVRDDRTVFSLSIQPVRQPRSLGLDKETLAVQLALAHVSGPEINHGEGVTAFLTRHARDCAAFGAIDADVLRECHHVHLAR
jgi:hypothetical protein